jgi:EAL domain-containing protein (putative c-di-GMP-specific phosphodiesterase class I)
MAASFSVERIRRAVLRIACHDLRDWRRARLSIAIVSTPLAIDSRDKLARLARLDETAVYLFPLTTRGKA